MRWMNTNTVKSVCRSWDGRTQTLLKASAGHEMNTFVKCVCRSWDVWTNTVNSNTQQYCHEMDQHKHCQMCKSWGGWTHCQKCRSWDGWTQTLSNVFRSWDGLTKTDIRAPPPPPPLPACSNESLANSYHTNRINFLPRDMNETAANASAYIERQHKNYYHVPVFCKKSRSVGSTWKRSKEEVTYNSPDLK